MCHHQEWFGSSTTNRHGVGAIGFATVSGCYQLVTGPTHALVVTIEFLVSESVGKAEILSPLLMKSSPGTL